MGSSARRVSIRAAGALIAALTAGSLAAACAHSGPVCRPVFSWAAPAHGCAAGDTMGPPPVVDEPVAPPEPPPPDLPIEPLKATLSDTSIDLAEKVQFDTGKATLLPASNELLDQVAQILLDHPEITKVRIEGHTDAQGSTRANQKLSQARAESVRAYLEDKGVDAGRMVAKGFGESKPVADNATPEGREQNRRVELTILERAP